MTVADNAVPSRSAVSDRVAIAPVTELSLDSARFEFAPRSVPEAFDTALTMLRSTFPAWSPGFVVVAFPSVAVVQIAGSYPNGLPWATLGTLMLATGFLGVVTLSAIFPVLFGRPASVAQAFEALTDSQTYRLALRVCLWRILVAFGMITCVFPGLLLGVFQGFLIENRLFRRVHRAGHDRRTQDLVNQHLADLTARALGISLLSMLLWLLLFFTLDSAVTLLFGVKVYLGRLELLMELIARTGEFDLAGVEWYDLTFRNPLVQSELLLTGLAAYLVGRVAWFLCYVDLRVRVDCWDMELQLFHDALRVTGRAPAAGGDS